MTSELIPQDGKGLRDFSRKKPKEALEGPLGHCGKSTPLQGCGTVAKQCARVVEKDMEKGVCD